MYKSIIFQDPDCQTLPVYKDVLIERCTRAHVTLKEIHVLQRGDVLGIDLDLTTQTTGLTTKFSSKHHGDWENVQRWSPTEEVPIEDVWRVVGTLIRGLQVLQKKLCFFFYMIRVIRYAAWHVVQKQSWEGTILIDQKGLAQIQWVARWFLTNPRSKFEVSQPSDAVVFFDAGPRMVGVVVWHHAKWHVRTKDVNLEHQTHREAFALEFSVDVAVELEVPDSSIFVSDAAAIQLSAKRSLSRSLAVNKAISKWRRSFPSAEMMTSSEKMPADEPSRGKDFPIAKGEQALKQTRQSGEE
jgi:hypothetical protein